MTDKQGQYLAFIYYYTKIHGRPPSEADLQGYFGVSPPAELHAHGLGAERAELIQQRNRHIATHVPALGVGAGAGGAALGTGAAAGGAAFGLGAGAGVGGATGAAAAATGGGGSANFA